MSVRQRSPRLIQPIIEGPIADRDRAFLRMLRNTAGGRMQLVRLYDRDRAEACEKAGYCATTKEGRCQIVRITSKGQAYLDKIMRAL
jgi:hypothetical protein